MMSSGSGSGRGGEGVGNAGSEILGLVSPHLRRVFSIHVNGNHMID